MVYPHNCLKMLLRLALMVTCVFTLTQITSFANTAEEAPEETEDGREPSTDASPTTDPLSPFLAVPLSPVSFVVPGVSHYIRGEEEVAKSFFWSGLGAIGLTVGGAVVLAASGAADAFILPAVPLVLLGGTTWFSLAFADVVGSTLSDSPSNNYKYKWDATWTAHYRYRRVNDYFFNTTGYHQVGGQVWFKNSFVAAAVEKNESNDISRYDLEFAHRFIEYPNSRHNEGLYARVGYTREDNLVGLYCVDTLTYTLKSIFNFSLLAPHLSRLVATHEVGIQQYFVDYHTPKFESIESDSGLIGGFDLSWNFSDFLKPALGYIHERDSSIGTLTQGFTGVYFAELEFAVLQDFTFAGRGYLGNSRVFDLTLEARI